MRDDSLKRLYDMQTLSDYFEGVFGLVSKALTLRVTTSSTSVSYVSKGDPTHDQ